MSNTVSNVSTGKPNPAGAIYWAPAGSTLPTDATTALDAAFKALGYISEDGLTNANGIETETIKAWGGDIVAVPQTDFTDTFQFKCIEVLNLDVLKFIYGADNVSGALATGITVKANASDKPAGIFVCDMAMRDGAKKRVVAPNAKLTELGDITYVDNDVAGYEATITAMAGGFSSGDNDTHKEYIIRA